MYIRSFLQDKQMTITLSGEIDHHEARHAMKTVSEKIESYMPHQRINRWCWQSKSRRFIL